MRDRARDSRIDRDVTGSGRRVPTAQRMPLVGYDSDVGLTAAAVRHLQGVVGNTAVTQLMVQRLPIWQIPSEGSVIRGGGQRFYYVAPTVGIAYGDNRGRPRGENIGIYSDGMTGCASVIVRHANGDLYLGHFPASGGVDYNVDLASSDEDDLTGFDSEEYDTFLSSLTPEEFDAHVAAEEEKSRKEANRTAVLEVGDRMHFSGAVSVLIAYAEASLANKGHQAAIAVRKLYKGTPSEVVVGDWVAMNTSGYVYSARNTVRPQPTR